MMRKKAVTGPTHNEKVRSIAGNSRIMNMASWMEWWTGGSGGGGGSEERSVEPVPSLPPPASSHGLDATTWVSRLPWVVQPMPSRWLLRNRPKREGVADYRYRHLFRYAPGVMRGGYLHGPGNGGGSLRGLWSCLSGRWKEKMQQHETEGKSVWTVRGQSATDIQVSSQHGRG